MEDRKVIFFNTLTDNREIGLNKKVNESEVINKLSQSIEEKLKENDYIIYKNELEDRIDNIIILSNKIKPDIHVSFNVGQQKGTISNLGPSIYTNKSNTLGEKLSNKIYNQLKLRYYDANYNKGVYFTDNINEVVNVNSPVCYIDLFYYDNENDNNWFMNNLEEISEAIYIGIDNYFKDRD